MPADKPAEASGSGQLEARLSALRARFAARLRQDAQELAQLAGQLACEGRSRETLQRLRALAHRMHGAAGTFGEMQTGHFAARVEAAADAALAEDAAERWEAQLAELETEIRKLQVDRQEGAP